MGTTTEEVEGHENLQNNGAVLKKKYITNVKQSTVNHRTKNIHYENVSMSFEMNPDVRLIGTFRGLCPGSRLENPASLLSKPRGSAKRSLGSSTLFEWLLRSF